jgi:hypothetical protein
MCADEAYGETLKMADLIGVLASRSGLDRESVQRGLGALLSFLKGRLDPDIYSKVHAVVPGSDDMIAAYEKHAKDHGGLIGVVAEIAGKVFGGHSDEGADLQKKLSHSGLDVDQAQALLPHAVEMLGDHLPPHLAEEVQPLLAAASTAAAPGGDTKNVPPA